MKSKTKKILIIAGSLIALIAAVYVALLFIANQRYQQLVSYQNRRLTVYVKNNVSAGDTRALADDIRLEAGTVKSQYVSKDEALKRIESETGNTWQMFASDNPLYAEYDCLYKSESARDKAADSLSSRDLAALYKVDKGGVNPEVKKHLVNPRYLFIMLTYPTEDLS